MKTSIISSVFAVGLALLSVGALPGQAQPGTPLATPTNRPVNYVVRVEWKGTNATPRSLQLTTLEGTFKLNTSLPGTVKVGEAELAISVSLEGTLKVLSPEQGQLQVFLGQSVPYSTRGPVPGSVPGPGGFNSIQQRQEGITASFVVTFGKPVLLQKDLNGEVYVTVTREKP